MLRPALCESGINFRHGHGEVAAFAKLFLRNDGEVAAFAELFLRNASARCDAVMKVSPL